MYMGIGQFAAICNEYRLQYLHVDHGECPRFLTEVVTP